MNDPNEMLRSIRTCIEALDGGSLSFLEQIDASNQLRAAVHALDEWLSGGGALPDGWQREAALT